MDTLPRNQRIWSIDLLRGFFLLTMIIAHSIFFFHAKSHPLLQITNAITDFISFTGLLLASGAAGYVAYIHKRHPTHSVITRVLKRLSVYLIGYYFLSIMGSSLVDGWSLKNIFQIVSFQKLVYFTEFIVPLMLFGLLKIPLRFFYDKIARSWLAIFFISVLAYSVGVYGSSATIPIIPTAWKAILVGEPGYYSFPLFQYTPVYLLGVLIGRQFWKHFSDKKTSKLLFSLAASSSLVLALLGITAFTGNDISLQLLQRWPPSLAFILASTSIALAILGIFIIRHDLRNAQITRTVLLILGQNAYAIYFVHTILVFLYRGFGFPQAHSLLLTFALSLSSLVIALYGAKILPFNFSFTLSLVNWCECKLGYCTHAQENRLIRNMKRLIFGLPSLSDVFSVQIGHRKFRLFKTRSFAIATAMILVTAIPLGIAENDLFFQRSISSTTGNLNRSWFLTTNANNTVVYTINIPDQVLIGQSAVSVFYSIDGGELIKMNREGKSWSKSIDLSSFDTGEYRVVGSVDINGRRYKTKISTYTISEPLYVTWTIDWEGYDASQTYLDALSQIADTHNIPMTHLFNPRIYTSDDMESGRADYLTDWVKRRQAIKGEEVGLHLHMFPDFVEEAGVEPKTEPIWGGGFTPGYDILTTAYSYEQMKTILNYGKKLLEEKGLGTPRSYRAGAWFANGDTLKALDDTGFLVDSSGRTSYTFGTNNVTGFWDLSPSTQPYYPSTSDQNSPVPPPTLNILEIPNNGADSFAFSSEDMIERFNLNYSGGALHSAKQLTFLSHPHWFNNSRQQAMKDVFEYTDKRSYDQDLGPVVYVTLQDVYQAWQQQ